MRKKIVRAPKVVKKTQPACPICNKVIAPAEDNIISYRFSDGRSTAIHYIEVYKLFKKYGKNRFSKLGPTMPDNFDLIEYFNQARASALANNAKGLLKTVGIITRFLDKVKVKKENLTTLSLTSYYGGFNESLKHGLILRQIG